LTGKGEAKVVFEGDERIEEASGNDDSHVFLRLKGRGRSLRIGYFALFGQVH